jgi:hypothetical protein
MRFREVAEKFAKDEKFRSEVQRAARQAGRDGIESVAWQRLASFFAENEKELALLTPPAPKAGRFQNTQLSRLLLLSDSDTTGGTTTTTTTTTSRYCSLPGICEAEAQAKKATKKKPTTKKRSR